MKPTATLIHMTGYVQPVSEWLNQIDNGKMNYYSWKKERIKTIKINGTKASLIGQNRIRACIWGSTPKTWPLQIKMSFEKIKGKWYMANQIASIY